MGADSNHEIGRKPIKADPENGGNSYQPHPIAGREFDFSNATFSFDSETTIRLARFDERVGHHPLRESIVKMLRRVEAMATVRSDGISPDLLQVLLLESMVSWGKDTPPR